jgi:hypothetical protein
MDGKVDTDKMTGTWSHPNPDRSGDFQVSREAAPAQAAAAPTAPPDLSVLKGDERRVVDFLLKDWTDWEEDYSITSVDMAMDALRIRQNDGLRFRIGNYIKNHPELNEVVRQWGWQTLVLTPTEKLVARAVVNAQYDKRPVPARRELARMVGVSEKQAENAVRMLARYGILKQDRTAGGIGYVASEERYINWQPWLDFQFHRMTLSSGRNVAVN